jgi:hypothetical protein
MTTKSRPVDYGPESESTDYDPEYEAVDYEGLKKATRKGLIAALLIAILSIIEYFIAISVTNPLWVLMPFVVLKGWIILDTFMHVRAIWSEDH